MWNGPSCLCSMLVTASTTTFLSMCIPHCVLTYCCDSFLSNVNTNINSFLANYNKRGCIPKGGGVIRRQTKLEGMKLICVVTYMPAILVPQLVFQSVGKGKT